MVSSAAGFPPQVCRDPADGAQQSSLLAVTEGAFIFKLQVSADMSPEVQVVAYAVLPSQGVIAHSAEFATEKCFSHIVGLHLRLPDSPSGAALP